MALSFFLSSANPFKISKKFLISRGIRPTSIIPSLYFGNCNFIGSNRIYENIEIVVPDEEKETMNMDKPRINLRTKEKRFSSTSMPPLSGPKSISDSGESIEKNRPISSPIRVSVSE